MIVILNVVVVVQTLEELEHLIHRLRVGDVDGVLRNHLHFGGDELVARAFQRLAHNGELVGIGIDFKRVVLRDKISRAGV